MDYQTLFNIFGSLALMIAGWFSKVLWEAVEAVRKDQSTLREELPKTYITKDDFKDAINELKNLLLGIDSKLDRKMDKKEL